MTEMTFMQAVNNALDLAMEKDDTVLLLGEDIYGGSGVEHLEEKNEDAWGGSFGVLKGLGPKYGADRVIDTPISEHGYMSAAVGMAATGLRPVPELMFNDFIGWCLDAILGQATKLRYMFGGKAKVPITVRTAHGAGVSASAQHSGSYYGILGNIPGLNIVVPATPHDAKGLLLACIEDDNPCFFFEDKTLYGSKGEVPDDYYTIEIGKAKVVEEGEDLTIVTIGKMLFVAQEAAEDLKEAGISTEIIDLRTVAPWDQETVLASARKTGRVIVVDEDNPHNNTATDIASVIMREAFDYLDGPVLTVCAPNTPVPFARNLEALYIPDTNKVITEGAELIDDLRQH